MAIDTQVLIELTTPLNYECNPTLFPTITHVRLVNNKSEGCRPNDDKPGLVNVWLAYGYLHEDVFHEAPGFPGLNILLEDAQFDSLAIAPIAAGLYWMEETKTICQWLVDNGYIIGTVIINEVEAK